MEGRRDYQADGLRQSHNAKVCVFDPDKFVNSHCCVVSLSLQATAGSMKAANGRSWNQAWKDY